MEMHQRFSVSNHCISGPERLIRQFLSSKKRFSSSSNLDINRGCFDLSLMKREEWMTDSFFKKQDKSQNKASTTIPGSHERELNPFWERNNGIPVTNTRSSESTFLNSWTKMKVKRALESIERNETSYEQAAMERFGSTEEFDRLCRLCGFKVERQSKTRLLVPKPSQLKTEDEPMSIVNKKKSNFSSQKSTRRTFECLFCEVDPESIVSEADYTFLVTPQRPISPLHFIIVPKCHEESTIECAAIVLNEIRNYKKSLIKLFAENGCLPVFIEMRRRARDSSQHVHVECFGVPEEQVDLSMVFRKSIAEAESYWATHQAIIECPDGLAKALPRRPFPFIHIDLWLESFAHIIEDDRWFPPEWPSETVKKVIGNKFNVHKPEFTTHDWTRQG